jgi:hypothetical protein
MKAVIEEIDIHTITRRDALELKNEINKATGGNLYFNDDFPRLKEFYELLNGCFDSSVNGVHTISKRH